MGGEGRGGKGREREERGGRREKRRKRGKKRGMSFIMYQKGPGGEK